MNWSLHSSKIKVGELTAKSFVEVTVTTNESVNVCASNFVSGLK